MICFLCHNDTMWTTSCNFLTILWTIIDARHFLFAYVFPYKYFTFHGISLILVDDGFDTSLLMAWVVEEIMIFHSNDVVLMIFDL